MAAPNYLAADFKAALLALMPTGRVWPKDADSVQVSVLGTLAPSYERQTAAANALLVDAFPSTAVQLLSEWEATLGLPDPCAGEAPSIALRQAQVIARFTSPGGQSAQYYIDYAATLGFAIEIANHKPFRMGQGRMGDPLGGIEWAHTWTVVFVGDPTDIEIASELVLQCELQRIAPAHTIVQFPMTTQLADEFGNILTDEFGNSLIT